MYFTLPACVADENLNAISASFLAIDDFSSFPPSLTNLAISNSRYVYGNNGFLDADNGIIWSAVWTRFPSLNILQITSSHLYGTLPAALPSNLYHLVISATQISGTIPPAFLSSVLDSTNGLTVSLASNQLSGSLPQGLFTGFRHLTSLSLDVSNNQINGSIPPGLLAPLAGANLTTAFFKFYNNRLSGEVSDELIPQVLLAPFGSLTLDVGSNLLVGTIPPLLLSNVTSFGALEVLINKNPGIFGSLPERLLPSPWSVLSNNRSTIVAWFDMNNLSGTIPPELLSGGLTSNSTLMSINLDLNSNQLTGPIPETLLYSTSGGQPVTISSLFLSVYLQKNLLEGPLPKTAFQFANPTASFQFAISENPNLTGTVPESLLAPIPDSCPIALYFGNTKLSGSPPSRCSRLGLFSLNMVNTMLNGTLPSSWAECALYTIDISNNPNFSAAIPTGLFSSSTLSSFVATDTPLTGIISEVSTSVAILSLGGTNIEFCSAPESVMGSTAQVRSCALGARACECSASYSPCLVACLPSPPLISPPVIAPPSSTSCPNITRPSAEFFCVNNVWTANSTNTTTLAIPSGAGSVIITGNLTSTSVVFHGVGSTVYVNGSVYNLTTITIEFDSSDVNGLGSKVLQILIASNTDGSLNTDGIDLNTVNVLTKVSSGCKKVKATKVLLDGGKTLGAYMSVDSSGCNTWWIVLVSVVVAVIVIAVVVVVLLAVFYQPFREKIRPYSAARRNRTTGVQ